MGGGNYNSGSGSGKLSWQGLPGGHLQNSKVAVLQPISELADDLLQKQVALVAMKTCFTVLGPRSSTREPSLLSVPTHTTTTGIKESLYISVS